VTQHHIPEEEVNDALSVYREALEDTITTFDVDADRDEVITEARRILGEDDPDLLEVIVNLDEGDGGDAVWQLEEEIVDDRLDDDFSAKYEDIPEE
jgi:hypothetical protein